MRVLTYIVVSIPTLTAPNGAAPGKTLPPLYEVPGTVPCADESIDISGIIRCRVTILGFHTVNRAAIRKATAARSNMMGRALFGLFVS
jgi:hypothetical protein